jgi:hypothetical protein
LDAASATRQGHGFRVKPQIQTLRVYIAAGVFSETLDYSERPKIRPENSCPTNQNNIWCRVRRGKDEKPHAYYEKDKGTAQLLEVVRAVPMLKNE